MPQHAVEHTCQDPTYRTVEIYQYLLCCCACFVACSSLIAAHTSLNSPCYTNNATSIALLANLLAYWDDTRLQSLTLEVISIVRSLAGLSHSVAVYVCK